MKGAALVTAKMAPTEQEWFSVKAAVQMVLNAHPIIAASPNTTAALSWLVLV